MAGLAFKASVAPFHQWTPDVYEGAPTPVTGFMAVATKAAAFGVILRLFDVALIDAATTWAPAFATLAVITIIVGNVGAIGQSSLKRMLAYSSVAQAGYMLAGVVVTTQLGVSADGLLPRDLRRHEPRGVRGHHRARARDRRSATTSRSLYGLGADRPLLAWPMTISMLALAGLPGDRGLLRQDLPDQRGRRQRLRVARHRDRARLRGLAGVLPARGRGGLDARRRPRGAAALLRRRGPRWPAARPRPTTRTARRAASPASVPAPVDTGAVIAEDYGES